MLLVPLAENAVKHGPAAGHSGEVRLWAQEQGGCVQLQLENPGPYRGPREGSDGLPTLHRRLEVAYGGRASLALVEREGHTRATLELPLAGPLEGVLT